MSAPLNRNARLPGDPDPDEGLEPLDDVTVTIEGDTAGAPTLNDDGSLSIPTEGGGVVIDFDPPSQTEPEDETFYANLAERLDEGTRARIVEELLQGIDSDNQSRQEWLDMRAEGIKMLGTTLEKAKGDAGNSTEPFEGMSTIRHPLLLEAVARFQANASAELYPPTGPVKVRDDKPSKPSGVRGIGDNGGPPLDDAPLGEDPQTQGAIAAASREELAEALEKGFNHNLTVVDRGYRPDSVRMLFSVGFGGCAFKKVYDCPIRERPISRFVDAADVIVSNGVSDERDAGRITHRITMRQSVVKRMQIAGVYREVTLHQPTFEPNKVEEATARAQGLADKPQRQEDQPRTIFETYCELDVPGYEHTRRGKITGLPLPYKVSIDKDARELLELRRNWKEEDDTYEPRRVFVKFGFIPALGFYDLGLLHLLGNGDKALTAAWREALDANMFANFPGFIYNEGVIRNWTNQNRVPPGGGIGIKAAGNIPLDNLIKPLPYKEVGSGAIAFIQHVEQRMDRVAGTAEIPVGEGRQDAPVGTTLALIEQATKILAAVHVGLHASQAEEFGLLKERYAANPEAFWRWNKKGFVWEEAEFLRALEDDEIVPAADPNTPSHMHRIMKAWAMLQVAQSAPPGLFDLKVMARRFFEMIGVADPDEVFAAPPPPQAPQGIPPDPNKMAATQQKAQEAAQEHDARMAQIAQESQNNQQDHQARLAESAADLQDKQQARQQEAQETAVESADRAAQRHSEVMLTQMKLTAEREKLGVQTAQKHIDALQNPPMEDTAP